MSALGLRRRLTELATTEQGDLQAVVGEFRRSEVLVPVVDGALLSVAWGGLRWLLVFTDGDALERFGAARGETYPQRVPVFGARLLDQVLPRIGEPTGVAVDAGSPSGLVLPPVAGLVPEAAVPRPEDIDEAAGRPAVAGDATARGGAGA